jgi:hypothetical protein
VGHFANVSFSDILVTPAAGGLKAAAGRADISRKWPEK